MVENQTNVVSQTPVVAAARIRVAEVPIRVGAPSATAKQGEPTIQLVREDGVVRAIDVTCACGEKIRIRCDYS